jgi:hypothetical protein
MDYPLSDLLQFLLKIGDNDPNPLTGFCVKFGRVKPISTSSLGLDGGWVKCKVGYTMKGGERQWLQRQLPSQRWDTHLDVSVVCAGSERLAWLRVYIGPLI